MKTSTQESVPMIDLPAKLRQGRTVYLGDEGVISPFSQPASGPISSSQYRLESVPAKQCRRLREGSRMPPPELHYAPRSRFDRQRRIVFHWLTAIGICGSRAGRSDLGSPLHIGRWNCTTGWAAAWPTCHPRRRLFLIRKRGLPSFQRNGQSSTASSRRRDQLQRRRRFFTN